MRVSLITVTFNSETTIRNTIQSVLSQTYPDIEYIIVDGLSEDRTINIIEEYETFFSGRMKWINEKDNGIYDAMNKGIQMATGDIIGILNSDDYFTSNRIIEQIVGIFENNIDAVYGDVHFVEPNQLNRCIRYYSSKIFKRSLMRFGFMPAHPAFYCKKECFVKYGLYKTDYKICADFDLLLRFIYVHRIKIKYIPLDMVTMRTGGVSTSGVKSHFRIMKEHLRCFRENEIKSNMAFLSLRYLYKVTELFRR